MPRGLILWPAGSEIRHPAKVEVGRMAAAASLRAVRQAQEWVLWQWFGRWVFPSRSDPAGRI